MPYTAPTKLSDNAVEQLLGKDAVMVHHRKLPVNNNIQVYSWLVNYPEQHLPNQYGRLNCHYISADEFGIRLLYLKHHFTSYSTAVVFSIHFAPDFLAQWDIDFLQSEKAFLDNHSGLQVPLDNQGRLLLQELSNEITEDNFSLRLRRFEIAMSLLRSAVEGSNKTLDVCSVPACSFLANNTEREKVLQAHSIIEAQFEQTITIRDLSRRVAMNECYLKKGFKAMFGKTINEFQQELRINKARQLLQTEGYTVSEVANILGYSSISHFSTAFKKATSMKPCELLK